MEQRVYAVPQSIIFRQFVAWEASTANRRLLLRNGNDHAVTFRLTLPKNGAFRVTGDCVQRATFDTISSVSLPPGGQAALTIAFLLEELPAGAPDAEVHDELVVRTRYETLHVPLAAVRDAKSPAGGDPAARYTPAALDEHWDEAHSDDEDVVAYDRGGGSARGGSARGGGGKRSGARQGKLVVPGDLVDLTPAGCTERDELDFYAGLIRDDVAQRAVEVEAARQELASRPQTADGGADAGELETVSSPARHVSAAGHGFYDTAARSQPPPVGPRSPVRVVQVTEAEAAMRRSMQPQPAAMNGGGGSGGSGSVSPPRPPRQTPQEIAQLARMKGASGPAALALAAAAAAEQEQEDELEFYRSFVHGKKHADAAATAQQQQHHQQNGGGTSAAPGRGSAAGVTAAGPGTCSSAQAQARRALEAGTYFIIGGIVTDSRGVELGPAAEVLGPEYAEDPEPPQNAPAPSPPGHPAPGGGSPRRYTASKGAAAALQFAAQGGGDPAMPGRNDALALSRDLGALRGAGLNTLRDAISPRGDRVHGGGGLAAAERASEASYDSYQAGLMPTMHTLTAGGGGGADAASYTQGKPMKLDLTTHWKPAGAGVAAAGVTIGGGSGNGGGAGLGGSIRGVAVKGGGGIVRSSAPKATLSKAEMEANWDALG